MTLTFFTRRSILVFVPLAILGLALAGWIGIRYERALRANQQVRDEIAQWKERTERANQVSLETEEAILAKLKLGVPVYPMHDSPFYESPFLERALAVVTDQLCDHRPAIRASAQQIVHRIRPSLSPTDKQAFQQMLLGRLGDPEANGDLISVLLRLDIDNRVLVDALLASIDQENYTNLEDVAHYVSLYRLRGDDELRPIYVDWMRKNELTERETVRRALEQRYFERKRMIESLTEAIEKSGTPEEQQRLTEWLAAVREMESFGR